MGYGWSNQWQHVLIGLSGLVPGLLVAFLVRPASWVPALIALVPGYVVWWLLEHVFQWPISPTSDYRLDTAFHTLGRVVAAIVCGVVASYLRAGG